MASRGRSGLRDGSFEVTSSKYIGAIVSHECSKTGVLSRIELAIAGLTKLKPILRDNNISFGSKVKLVRSLSVPYFRSTLVSHVIEKRTQAFGMRRCRRLLNISYKDHVTSEDVHRKNQAAIEKYDELLTLVKKRKLRWFGLLASQRQFYRAQ